MCRTPAQQAVGVVPLAPEPEASAKPSTAPVSAVFLSNTKSRRAKLSEDELTVLASLGLGWAA